MGLSIGVPFLAALLGSLYLLRRERNIVVFLGEEIANQVGEKQREGEPTTQQGWFQPRHEVDVTTEAKELSDNEVRIYRPWMVV